MPVYEYYCRQCAAKFEKLQRMNAAAEAAVCPSGHPGAARTLSLFATFTRGEGGEMQSFGGGCACGGACACGGYSAN
jgi:putative FmdB family regulatory protein